jgi:hypothetical protein
MWSHRRSHRGTDPEAALRALRAGPREEFVRTLARKVEDDRPPVRRPWSRLAFAGAVSTLILGMFASFGGLGYTASGASTTYYAVKEVVSSHKVALTVRKSSASDQYGRTPSSPQGTPASSETKGESGAVAAARSGGTLPFTGFSLLATFVVASMLIGVGLVLRRRERNDR